MKTIKIGEIIFGVMMCLMVVTGCATTQDKMTHVGFLSDYSGFERGPAGGANWRYINKNVDFKKYNKILMEHVAFYFADQSKYKGIHPDELNKLADEFHKYMVEAVGDAYPFVDEPGPDVIRIRVAITDLVANKPVMGSVTAITPMGAVMGAVKEGVTGVNTFVGQAAIEAELLDSQTNERLAAVIDRRVGKKYEQYFEGMQKWGHVEEAFKWWARRLRDWLDEAHSGKSPL